MKLEEFREQVTMVDEHDIGDSVVRSFRWLLGGAAGGMVTHWMVNGYGDLALAAGAGTLFITAVVCDVILKMLLPNEMF